MSGERTHFIYALVDTRDDSIRYIGQSLKPEARAIRHVHDTTRNQRDGKYLTIKERWLVSLLEAGLRPICRIIDSTQSKAEIDKAEVRWIAYYRALAPGVLTNTSSGGASLPPGIHPSEETIRRISAAKTGRKASPAELAHIQKLAARRRGQKMNPASYVNVRAANLGRPKTPEERAKLSKANKGKTASPAARAKISAAKKKISPEQYRAWGLARKEKGFKHSAETLARMSATQKAKGLKLTPEHIEKLRAVNKGKFVSVELRRQMSEARKGTRLSPEHRAKSVKILREINARRRAALAEWRNDPRQAVLF